MNIKTKIALTLACSMIATGALAQAISGERLSADTVRSLGDTGAKAFCIQWQKDLVGASHKGVQAVTDGVTTLTVRPASRTYIVNNRKLTATPDALQFGGSDDALKDIGLRALASIGADKGEIAGVRVLQQMTQAGYRDRAGKVALQPEKRSARTLLIERQVDGVPVVSSRAMFNVDRAGRIAFMEICWPALARDVVDRAHRLHEIAGSGYKAPPMAGASVESVSAVILHSPAVSFHDDATAAIRVVYRPDKESIGKRAVRYLDENGRDVTLPRQIDLLREEPVTRPAAAKQRS
jgi:hypothetical protein